MNLTTDRGFTQLDGARAEIAALKAQIRPLKDENERLKDRFRRLAKAITASQEYFDTIVREIVDEATE